MVVNPSGLQNPPDPAFDQVNAYQKIMKTGRAVVVRNYQRKGINHQNIGRYVFLGRPAIAATPGTFANGRSTPGLWTIADNSPQQ